MIVIFKRWGKFRDLEVGFSHIGIDLEEIGSLLYNNRIRE
jgi:hypothetical protein